MAHGRTFPHITGAAQCRGAHTNVGIYVNGNEPIQVDINVVCKMGMSKSMDKVNEPIQVDINVVCKMGKSKSMDKVNEPIQVDINVVCKMGKSKSMDKVNEPTG